jgi:hypothetical protein
MQCQNMENINMYLSDTVKVAVMYDIVENKPLT